MQQRTQSLRVNESDSFSISRYISIVKSIILLRTNELKINYYIPFFSTILNCWVRKITRVLIYFVGGWQLIEMRDNYCTKKTEKNNHNLFYISSWSLRTGVLHSKSFRISARSTSPQFFRCEVTHQQQTW